MQRRLRSSPSAAASRATAYAKRSAASAATPPSRSTKFQPGTQVFDWTVPKEWNIREAWIKDPSGRTVVDFADSNLHVLNGSAAVQRTLPLSELKSHIFTLPDMPDLVPYRTAYAGDRWGFCMPHRLLEALPDGPL